MQLLSVRTLSDRDDLWEGVKVTWEGMRREEYFGLLTFSFSSEFQFGRRKGKERSWGWGRKSVWAADPRTKSRKWKGWAVLLNFLSVSIHLWLYSLLWKIFSGSTCYSSQEDPALHSLKLLIWTCWQGKWGLEVRPHFSKETRKWDSPSRIFELKISIRYLI